MAKNKILVIEDDDDIQELITYNLVREGYLVSSTTSGEAGLEAARRSAPDLVLLDLMLPGIDGLEVCRMLRADHRTAAVPIVMLTAKGEETDVVTGLEVGADDYITKPFSPREVVARVRTILRRDRGAQPDQRTALVFDRLIIDVDGHTVSANHQPVNVSSLEFDLLVALANAPQRVFSRAQLLERVWGSDFYGDERVVDVHIRSLRARLGDDANDPHLIATVRGVGYKFIGTRA